MRQVNKFDPCISSEIVCSSVRTNEGCWGEGSFPQNVNYFTLLKHLLETKLHRIFPLCFMLLFERSLMKPMALCSLSVAYAWMESSVNRYKIALISSFSYLVENLFWQNFLKKPLFDSRRWLLTIFLFCVALLVLGWSVLYSANTLFPLSYSLTVNSLGLRP